ncbi:acetylornithine deacetylase/succinyl-diaminopimelate desuccinylase-like protein [Paenibacillus shirakamiensis]|uniref:Acetylornithine deacetylase/succinyl-diaminopimelate desuccinylase-like protein n=1 Tax=Paenibacillus shirakamiensis TaxID=1265935 RepID=A0ABS4JNG7_9BACL|nr:dipeptidase [Paenibacillus shirakamiensis]MBP2002169.1 acetylornithine deacetylase/succinyl-diaminopimelate desuccinylase-like protein [Paenibacillus shirakamiensis]
MTVNYKTYFDSLKEQHLDELKELLTIPSISALSVHKPDIAKAASWIADALTRAGLEHVKIHQTEGHPIIYADHLHAPGQPTVLIYGHYDVQPVDPLNLWDTPPFEPSIRDGKLYARGATDDKGQMFLHIKAIEAILKEEGTLPVNVKFVIEGEEEISSPHLPGFLDQHQEELSTDVILISDTSLFEKGRPAISTGLRGLCSLEVSVHTANTDLHSGTFGGGVPNALHAIVSLLASLHDDQGRIAVEGFYKGVPDLTQEMHEEFEKQQFNEESLRQDLSLDSLYGEEGYSFVERTGARPTLELNGVYGGFQGEGSKTVIPKEAHAKITCRLVGHQDPQDMLDKIEAHLCAHLQAGAKLEVKQMERANAFIIDPSNPYLQKAADAYETVYGTRALFTKDGGSIPIVETFTRVLSAPVVMMGFGLPDENLHAPNEHFNLENFDLGLLTIVEYLKSL